MKYVPRKQFLPFHNRSQRGAAIVTHRRAGKTIALVNDLILGALECRFSRPQLAYVGPTYRQTKITAWAYMKDYAEEYLESPPSESELSVTLVGGRKIYCLGSDNPDALRGMYLDGAVLDERSVQRPSVFSEIVRPALSDRNGWWVFAGTPKGKNHFFDECEQARKSPDRSFFMKLSADVSGIIPEKELTELREDMDPEEFAQEYLCSFDSALKGAVYADEVNEMFTGGRAVSGGLYDASLPVHVAYDLGFTDATVATFWQRGKDGTVRVIQVHATTGEDIMQHILLLQKLGIEDPWLPHDARAKNLQTGMSIVEQFLKAGLKPHIVPDHKVRDRLSTTRALFPRIYIDQDKCGRMLEALRSYRRTWDDRKLMFNDTPYHDWASDYADSFGYMAVVDAIMNGVKKTHNVIETSDVTGGYTLCQLLLDNERVHVTRARLA